MPEPRVIAETDLHNDCGLIAAVAWKFLMAHGVKARILCYNYGKEGHRVTVFESAEGLAVYDSGGTRSIYRATLDTPPLRLAAAIMRAEGDKRKVTKARWE